MHSHRRIFATEGVVLIVLGLAAIVLPLLAGLFATVLLGWVFLLAVAMGLFSTVRTRGAPGFVWALLSAVAAIFVGGLLLWNPFRGLLVLTYVLTSFFIVDGVLTIGLALAHRRELSKRWGWMIANGAILLFAALVIVGMPGSLVWVLGLLVGIDLSFAGGTLIAMALSAREDGPATTAHSHRRTV